MSSLQLGERVFARCDRRGRGADHWRRAVHWTNPSRYAASTDGRAAARQSRAHRFRPPQERNRGPVRPIKSPQRRRADKRDIVPGIQGMVFSTQGTGQIKIAILRAATPPVPSTLALTDAVTVELSVNRRAATTSRNPAEQNRLIGKWLSETSPGWRLDVEPVSGRLRWEIVTKATDTKTGAVFIPHLLFVTYETVPTNEWRPRCRTYDGKRMRVFEGMDCRSIDGADRARWKGSRPFLHRVPIRRQCLRRVRSKSSSHGTIALSVVEANWVTRNASPARSIIRSPFSLQRTMSGTGPSTV